MRFNFLFSLVSLPLSQFDIQIHSTLYLSSPKSPALHIPKTFVTSLVWGGEHSCQTEIEGRLSNIVLSRKIGHLGSNILFIIYL